MIEFRYLAHHLKCLPDNRLDLIKPCISGKCYECVYTICFEKSSILWFANIVPNG